MGSFNNPGIRFSEITTTSLLDLANPARLSAPFFPSAPALQAPTLPAAFPPALFAAL